MKALNLNQSKWFAVSTKFKCEKSVQKRLLELGIHSYLPLQKLLRIWGKRKRTVELPLISCYVFVKIKKKEYVPVLQVDNVVGFVKISNELIAIPENEIEILKKVAGNFENEAAVISNDYHVGDDVELIYGSLSGLKGKLVNIEGKDNFVIKLKHIGCSLIIQVKNKHLRKIN